MSRLEFVCSMSLFAVDNSLDRHRHLDTPWTLKIRNWRACLAGISRLPFARHIVRLCCNAIFARRVLHCVVTTSCASMAGAHTHAHAFIVCCRQCWATHPILRQPHLRPTCLVSWAWLHQTCRCTRSRRRLWDHMPWRCRQRRRQQKPRAPIAPPPRPTPIRPLQRMISTTLVRSSIALWTRRVICPHAAAAPCPLHRIMSQGHPLVQVAQHARRNWHTRIPNQSTRRRGAFVHSYFKFTAGACLQCITSLCFASVL